MSHPKILLIEDNGSDAYLLRRSLQVCDSSVEVTLLTDGESAIHYVREQHAVEDEEHPCVIVLDLGLPRYNGLEVLRTIRSESALNHVHVVVVAGAASPSEEESLRALGAHFRIKPSNLADYESLAENILELCRSRMSASKTA